MIGCYYEKDYRFQTFNGYVSDCGKVSGQDEDDQTIVPLMCV